MSYSKRRLDQKHDEDFEVEDDDEKERDEDVEFALAHFLKKGKGKSSEIPRRKPRWCPKSLDDFVDVVVSSNEFKNKLIFTNTKNQRNGPLYAKILYELKERASVVGDKFTMTFNQMRTKFKKCVSQCKQAALTQKTATGIKRYQEDRGFGKWFNALFDVVKTRDSCRPERAVEPSTSSSSPPCTPESSLYDPDNVDDEVEMFVPKRSAKKGRSKKDKLDINQEVIQLIQEAVRNDPTKEMISFLRDEMEKSRGHELKLFN